MRIRLFNKKDLEEVSNLIVDSYKKEDKKRRWNNEMIEKYILLHLRLNKDLCFVATEGDKIIGTGLCILKPQYNQLIMDSHILVVHKDFRKQGIGGKILKKMVEKSNKKYGVEQIETSIYNLTNFPISWYESLGFREKNNHTLIAADINQITKGI
ncbi:MAG: GNAT family N-acetyltransferase [Clostridia bacterium]|nr:GNAT family N-acetyltransferase [Clostridia bacterium]MDD4375719.1 GNAT family N-acetyltransferase [Clostridia bacterium]